MSTVKTEVTTIRDVRTHPNADNLQLATVAGWQVCVRKGAYRDGDPIVYIESGSTMPSEIAERLGVRNYLAEKTNIDGQRVLVVHRVKLRGEPSFGLVLTPEPGMHLGDDVAGHYGVRKYEPPVRLTASDAAPDHPWFPQYTGIENLRSYPEMFELGERVAIHEKLHGTNTRVGIICSTYTDVVPQWVPMAGSHRLVRKPPVEGDARQSIYWFPWSISAVKALLAHIAESLSCDSPAMRQVVLYGEVFGPGIQSYTYGQSSLAFRAFDLMIDGQYVDVETFWALCDAYNVPTVPLVGVQPYSLDAIKEASEGVSLIGGRHGREGVVVRPMQERNHAKIGRVIGKYLSDAYLFSKAGEHDSTDA